MEVNNITRFKNTCIEAIKTAKSPLKEHREWPGILASFLLAILTLGASRRWEFFSVKTDSHKKLNSLENNLVNQTISMPL